MTDPVHSNVPCSIPTIQLNDIEIHVVSEQETCEHIISELKSKRGGYVVTVNLDHLLRCQRNPKYFELVQQANLVVADGMPLVWASRLQGTPLPERVAGSTLCLSLASELAKARKSLFLLGGNPGVAEKAKQILEARFEGLQIVGTFCPPLGFENDASEMATICNELESAQPDVV